MCSKAYIKTVFRLICIIMLAFSVSCNKSQTPEVTESETDATTAKPLSEYEVMGGEYRNEFPFEHFFVFPDSNSIYREQQSILNMIYGESISLRVMVTGFLPEMISNSYEHGIYLTYYSVKITGIYNNDTDYELQDEYMISYMGSPQVQFFRLPMLNIGGEYILLGVRKSIASECLPGVMWLRIYEIDGTEYVYPYFLDCSELENNLPITSADEAEMYDDPAVIAYMDANDIEHPLFQFKFELNDFLTQIEEIRETMRSESETGN